MTSKNHTSTELWVIKDWISVSDMAPFNIFLGLTTFACSVIGVPSSAIAVSYFLRHPHKRLSTHLSTLLCLTNCAICTLSLPMAISGMTNNSSMLFQYSVFCTLWGVTWSTLDRMLLFILVVFSITRVVVLRFPFLHISNSCVLVPIGAYFLISLLQGLLPLLAGSRFQHVPFHTAACVFDMTEIFPFRSAGYITMTAVFVLVQVDLQLTALAVVIGKVLVMLCRGTRNRSHSNSRQTACITIVMIAGIYFILNLPYAIFFTLHFIETLASVRLIKLTLTNKTADILLKFLYEVLTLHVITFSSTIATLVLYARNLYLRHYLLSTLLFWKSAEQAEPRALCSRFTSSTHCNSKNVTIELCTVRTWRSAIWPPVLPIPPSLPESRSAPELRTEYLISGARPRSNSYDVSRINTVRMHSERSHLVS